jgi:TRAP-type C4-dicarboxylate transport system substrate-binding protein
MLNKDNKIIKELQQLIRDDADESVIEQKRYELYEYNKKLLSDMKEKFVARVQVVEDLKKRLTEKQSVKEHRKFYNKEIIPFAREVLGYKNKGGFVEEIRQFKKTIRDIIENGKDK